MNLKSHLPCKNVNDVSHSALILGTAQLGMPYGAVNRTGQPSRPEAKALLRQAIEAGVTHLDTAQAYGEAEEIIGQVLQEIRTRPVIITKLDPLDELDEAAEPQRIRTHVQALLERSRIRLQTGTLDVLMLHRWAHRHAWQGTVWEALQAQLKTGAIGALGASVQNPQEALAALEDPAIRHLQIPFNLLDWRWKAAGLAEAVTRRPEVAIHARSTLLQGLLTAPPNEWPTVQGIGDYSDACHAVLTRLCRDLKRESPADLCFAYVRGQPWITSVVAGMETMAQMEANLNLFSRPPLTLSEIEQVDQWLPPAPEALLNPALWPSRAEAGLTLRPATPGDCRNLFEWRNHPDIRRFSRDSELIDWPTHEAWFERALANPERLILIGEVGAAPVGVVRYDRNAPEAAEISVYTVPGQGGKGYGTALIREGSTVAAKHFDGLHRIDATVLPENAASHRAFIKAGFTATGKNAYQYHLS